MKSTEIKIKIADSIILKANLSIPDLPKAIVIFSHGSGSSRYSLRNKHVAEVLNQSNFVTVLVDLLTEEEDSRFETRFNIDLLTDRLIKVSNYIIQFTDFKNLPLGYFGTSTGVAATLKAEARMNDIVKAIVSRGGRPDLAFDALTLVEAPTLLIVGSLDTEVLFLNKQALQSLNCEKELKIIDGASHLFEEPGKLDEVAKYAVDWFTKYLVMNFISTLIK